MTVVYTTFLSSYCDKQEFRCVYWAQTSVVYVQPIPHTFRFCKNCVNILTSSGAPRQPSSCSSSIKHRTYFKFPAWTNRKYFALAALRATVRSTDTPDLSNSYVRERLANVDFCASQNLLYRYIMKYTEFI